MTRTGEQLIDGLSRFIGDTFASTTTGAGSTTTLVDTALTQFGDRRLEGWFIRITENVAGNQYLVRRISNFAAATGTVTVTPAFAGATGSGTDYELHRYDPAEKFRAIDDARVNVFGDVFNVVRDETITCDGQATEFNIPSTLSNGPIAVYEELPISVGYSWNLLTSPELSSLTGWTASAGTAEIVQRSNEDKLIPKYDIACTRLAIPSTTAVTYSQVVADINVEDATEAAGRRMTFAVWVYARVSGRVTALIVDNSGTAGTSQTHSGKGWELLFITADIAGANSTTLTVRVSVSSGTQTVIFLNRAWFFYGDQMPLKWSDEPLDDVSHDATLGKFTLMHAPRRGRQLRLMGRSILTALGDTVSTQPAATMEVDTQTEKLVFAEAAMILFRRLGLKVSDAAVLQRNLAIVDEERSRLRMNWALPTPRRRMEGPFN